MGSFFTRFFSQDLTCFCGSVINTTIGNYMLINYGYMINSHVLNIADLFDQL